jgi:N-acetylneuraminate synthase
MSSWEEIDAAVEALATARGRLTLLQCTSMYPCPYEHVGLNVITEMRTRYALPVGLSDHTSTNYASFAAVALGAEVIEKHFTLSRHLYGSDAAHSIEPAEFRDLAAGVRAIHEMRAAPVNKSVIDAFADMRRVFQKSVVAVVDIPQGTVIGASMLAIKKPGTGLAPSRLHDIVGCRARRAIPADSVLTEADLER